MDYNVRDFGARSGDDLQTRAIQQAIDACFLSGGGRVTVPAGVYRIATLRLRSNVELYLCSGAYLEGSRDPEDYMGWEQDALEPTDPASYAHRDASTNPFSRWSNAVIKAFRAKNIAITGEPGSFLDGVDCYDAQGEEGYRGPHMMNFHECENVRLSGYTIRRSANWAHAIFHSQNIFIDGITIYGGHDGIDVRTCDHVQIQNCTLITGDDCVAGFDDIDVQIRDCYCESSTQIIRLGGTDILIERIRSKAPAGYGFRGSLNKEERAASAPTHAGTRHRTRTPFLYFCDFRAVIRRTPGNILVRDCYFDRPNALFWMPFGEQKWCVNKPLAQIKFQNCVFDGLCDTALIHGGEETPIRYELENCILTAREGSEDMILADAARFESITFRNVTLKNFRNPVILTDGSGKLDAGDSGVTLQAKNA